MRALVFDDGLKVMDAPIPERGIGQALIRVTFAGICNTDVEVTRGILLQGIGFDSWAWLRMPTILTSWAGALGR